MQFALLVGETAGTSNALACEAAMDRHWDLHTAKITATCAQFDERRRRRGFGFELGVKVQTSPTVDDRNAA